MSFLETSLRIPPWAAILALPVGEQIPPAFTIVEDTSLTASKAISPFKKDEITMTARYLVSKGALDLNHSAVGESGVEKPGVYGLPFLRSLRALAAVNSAKEFEMDEKRVKPWQKYMNYVEKNKGNHLHALQRVLRIQRSFDAYLAQHEELREYEAGALNLVIEELDLFAKKDEKAVDNWRDLTKQWYLEKVFNQAMEKKVEQKILISSSVGEMGENRGNSSKVEKNGSIIPSPLNGGSLMTELDQTSESTKLININKVRANLIGACRESQEIVVPETDEEVDAQGRIGLEGGSGDQEEMLSLEAATPEVVLGGGIESHEDGIRFDANQTYTVNMGLLEQRVAELLNPSHLGEDDETGVVLVEGGVQGDSGFSQEIEHELKQQHVTNLQVLNEEGVELNAFPSNKLDGEIFSSVVSEP